MKTKALVLGCGRVGQAIARDLAQDDSMTVSIADIDERSLARLSAIDNLTTQQADLSDPPTLSRLARDADVVVGALPSRMGLAALRTVIGCGKPYCDISFMAEDALALSDLARERGVTAVVDCGVSPGLSNMIVGYAHARLDRADRARIYVGGLPKQRRWPYEYKAPFAPSDVLEEYTRPARIMEGGQVVTKPALSECEPIDIPGIGTLEAFNTDGLRSLLNTVPIPDMVEKTMRYPGHAELMRVLRETGFFDPGQIEVDGRSVCPLNVTSKLLFDHWRFEEGEPDFTVLRVEVDGRLDGKAARFTYELHDEYDPQTGLSSMARTTGFPAAIVARWLAKGKFTDPGVFAPEHLAARKELFDAMIVALDKRGVKLSGGLCDNPQG